MEVYLLAEIKFSNLFCTIHSHKDPLFSNWVVATEGGHFVLLNYSSTFMRSASTRDSGSLLTMDFCMQRVSSLGEYDCVQHCSEALDNVGCHQDIYFLLKVALWVLQVGGQAE